MSLRSILSTHIDKQAHLREMSNETIVELDETFLRLPSCFTLHAQLRSKLSTENYSPLVRSSKLCGIVRENDDETRIVALAAYRVFLTTYDTIRFEIDDFIVDENERNHGLGTRLLQYLVEQAKQQHVRQILIHCEPTNTRAHRFFFRFGLTIIMFEFNMQGLHVLPENDQIHAVDITDLPEEENERWLIDAQDIYRQLRPHLPTDQQNYIKQIREICRTGPARMIVVVSKNESKEILGLALYRFTENALYSQHIYCDDLVTNEIHRSSGVGRCLINSMKNEGIKRDIHRLILDSGCQRGRAHKFYHREGFIISRFGFVMTM